MNNTSFEILEAKFEDIRPGDLVQDSANPFHGNGIGIVRKVDSHICYSTPTGGSVGLRKEDFNNTVFYRPAERKILAGSDAYALLTGARQWRLDTAIQAQYDRISHPDDDVDAMCLGHR